MGTSCTLPVRQRAAAPNRICIGPNNNTGKELSDAPTLDPRLELFTGVFSEDLGTNSTTAPALKFSLQELGIGEYYLEKELVEIKKTKILKKKKDKNKKAHHKWDKAVVKMRGLSTFSLQEDSLYCSIDLCIREFGYSKPQKYTKMIKKDLPMRYRWSIWKNFVDINKFYVANLYERYKVLSSPWEKTIKKDVHRSFPEESFFSADKFERVGQDQLFNVLKAISIYFPNIGYTQSMNFLVGFMLLINGGNELEAFWMFITLARDQRFMLMGLFEKDLPLLDFYIYTFYELLQKEMPAVFEHLKEQQLPDQMWLLKWFMTMYLYSLPSKYVVKIWDFILQDGLLGIVKIALGILNFFEAEIVTLDIIGLDQLFRHLNSEKKQPNCPSATNRSFHEVNEMVQSVQMARFSSHHQIPQTEHLPAEKESALRNMMTIQHENSEINISFKEIDIHDILDYAKKIDLDIVKVTEIITSYSAQLNRPLPLPYTSLLTNWKDYLNSPSKSDELQRDIDYYIMKNELMIPMSDEIVIFNLLEKEESVILKNLAL